MNKGYINIDGKVIISDEKGNYSQTDYYDGIEKVLVQENIIEQMENKMQELTEKRKQYPKTMKNYRPYPLYTFAGASIVVSQMVLFLLYGSTSYAMPIDTIYGPMNFGFFITAAVETVSIVCGSIISAFDYSQHKKSKRNMQAIDTKLECLKLQKEKEEEVLKQLKKKDKKEIESTDYIVAQVDDQEIIDTINSYIDLYCKMGEDSSTHSQLQQKDSFEKKLNRNNN